MNTIYIEANSAWCFCMIMLAWETIIYYAQMLPLLKRSSDNLVAVISEKATSEGSFDVIKYVIMTSVPCTTCILDDHNNNNMNFMCRVYRSFTLETVIATSFGRVIDIQRGESDKFSKSLDLLLENFIDGRFEELILLHSKLLIHVCATLDSIFIEDLTMSSARSLSMVDGTTGLGLFSF